MTRDPDFSVLDLIRCDYSEEEDMDNKKYYVVLASPATGVLYVTEDNPRFIAGHIGARGRKNGGYPYNYLGMIERIFGRENNTIEVCAGMMREHYHNSCFTVDINCKTNPDSVDDGQLLSSIQNNTFSRWRCDPPYNVKTARKMYGTDLPSPIKLLSAGARVCNVGSLMFLLLGPQNYQWHPSGVMRIGLVTIGVVPNNEFRTLNIFYKYGDKSEVPRASDSLRAGSSLKKKTRVVQSSLDAFSLPDLS
jgi:hypothetical protein